MQSDSHKRNNLNQDQLLRKTVAACASNIAVFSVAGVPLYVSSPWRVFAEENGFSKRPFYGLDQLRACNAFGERSKSRSLLDDVQTLAQGSLLELNDDYVFTGIDAFRWFRVRAGTLDLSQSGPSRILVTLEDFTRRRQAEEDLRNIGSQLIRAQEEERSRVGRELHDSLSQRLTIFSIELEELRQKLPAISDLQCHVDVLQSRARELCSDVHRLSYRLHPFKLEYLGLSEAIRSLCQELSEYHTLKIEFHQQGLPPKLPAEIELCLFRITQESLNNIIKHSGATEAEVALSRTPKELRLTVSDNGCGFDVQLAGNKHRLGLISIKERIRQVGGELAIHSQPSRGSQLDVLVPLPRRVGTTMPLPRRFLSGLEKIPA